MAGSLIPRGENTWLVRVYLGRDANGKRINYNKTIHGTKKDAQRHLNQVLRDRDLGELSEPSRKTLNEYLDEWLETAAKRRTQARTLEGYASILRLYVRPHLGHERLSKLNRGQVQGLYNQLERAGLSPTTIRLTHKILGQALQKAVAWGYLQRSPAEFTERPQVRRRPMTVMDQDQAQRFTAAAQERPYWGTMFLLALTSGMRPGEYLGLGWDQLDGVAVSVTRSLVRLRDGGFLLGDVKTPASRRRILLPAFLLPVLKAHRRHVLEMRVAAGHRWTQNDLVFPREDGMPWNPSAVAGHFRRFIRRLGLPKMRLYDLRHTCATLLLLGGMNPKVVSERLGHVAVNITLDTYTHVLPNLQEAAGRCLEQVLLCGTQEGTLEKSSSLESARILKLRP